MRARASRTRSASAFRRRCDWQARYGLAIDDANMTVMTAVVGDDRGSSIEGRQRIMVGGVVTAFALEQLVYPAVRFLWRRKGVPEGPPAELPISVREVACAPGT